MELLAQAGIDRFRILGKGAFYTNFSITAPEFLIFVMNLLAQAGLVDFLYGERARSILTSV